MVCGWAFYGEKLVVLPQHVLVVKLCTAVYYDASISIILLVISTTGTTSFQAMTDNDNSIEAWKWCGDEKGEKT